MSPALRLPPALGDYAQRVARALDRQRLTAVAMLALLLSLGVLFSPNLIEFFTPAEIAIEWLHHLAELAAVAALLTVAYTLADEALPRRLPWRMALLGVFVLAMSVVATLLLYGWYAQGFAHLPPALRLASDALRFGLPALFLALVADVHRCALTADAAASQAEHSQAELAGDEAEQQLALLQAQIEPHFLFNTLGNVRRLYRTRPDAGAQAIASLMHCLGAALPRLRGTSTCVADELDLVRAWLDLLSMRMGDRLRVIIDADPALRDAALPPMLLMTLVENAIKHGLEPLGGGELHVRVRRRRQRLELTVEDDGAGFGAAAPSGSGVGLANVRRQLSARYGHRASLSLVERTPHGVHAAITLPLHWVAPVGP